MLGQLPTTLEVNGVSYNINTDYRNVLRVFVVLNADDLTDSEKVYVCLQIMYRNLNSIPASDYPAAYNALFDFIDCRTHSDKPEPRIVDWEKDEQLIFSAINKVAGTEIRAVQNMHWWTFLGYFQAIDRDDIWGFILTIRQKKAKHKKLEKYEAEFYAANRAMCEIAQNDPKKGVENQLAELFNELQNE